MQTLAIVFFCGAAVLSAVLVPNNMAMIPIVVLSIARAIALALALLFWVASGRLDAWSPSRLVLFLMIVLGTAALAGGCLLVQIAREDAVPTRYRILYRVVLALLPLCFMGGALLSSRKLFLIAAAMAPVAGILVISTWKDLNKEYVDNLPHVIAGRKHAELVAAKTLKFESIPETAGLEPLLEFASPAEDYTLKEKTIARIEQTPEWIAQLSAMLEGSHRVPALYALGQRVDRLPDAVVDRCWTTAGLIAADLTRRFNEGPAPAESEEESLLRSVEKLGDQSAPMRARHWKEIVAVHQHFLAVHSPLNTVFVDSWVRESQFQRIPESAGIEPLLDFTGIGEDSRFRNAALARIDKTPDSTAILAKALDGPHRLGALIVLSNRAEQLTGEARERCMRTAGLIAKDMTKSMEQSGGAKPTAEEVRNLQAAVRSIWITLNPVQDRDLIDLASIRELVRIAAADWDKANIAWADGVLAASNPARSGGNPR